MPRPSPADVPAAAPAAPPAGATGTRFHQLRSRIEHDDVVLDHHRVHLRRARPTTPGPVPTMVLMHGLIDSAVSWEPVMPAFARHADVVAMDLLGHGRSDKPRTDYSIGAHTNLLRDLLDQRGHDRIVLIGHSLGGGVAMQFNYQYPDRCDAMVLVAAGGLGRAISPWLRVASLPGVVPAMGLATSPPVRRSLDAVRRHALRTGADRRAWNLANTGRILDDLSTRSARDAFKNTLRGVIDHSGQRNLALGKLHLARTIPTLLVWGSRDPIIPVAHAHRAAELAGGEVAVIDGAGHAPHRSHPDEFTAVVTDFLRRRGVLG